MREQIAKSIQSAAALTPAPNVLGVSEISLGAETGKLNAIADKVVAIVSELGGSATKGVPDAGRLSILVDLPANRESEFRGSIAAIGNDRPASTPPATAAPSETTAKKSFVVQIAEATPKKE
jgi:hypothetical protein